MEFEQNKRVVVIHSDYHSLQSVLEQAFEIELLTMVTTFKPNNHQCSNLSTKQMFKCKEQNPILCITKVTIEVT